MSEESSPQSSSTPTGKKVKCIGRGYYKVKMDDGKLFSILYNDFSGKWFVTAGLSAGGDELVECKTLKEAKAAIPELAARHYPDDHHVWYGTKWGNVFFKRGNAGGCVRWEGWKPEGWEFDFFAGVRQYGGFKDEAQTEAFLEAYYRSRNRARQTG